MEQLQRFGQAKPEWALFADRLLVGSYEDFVRILYIDIDQCLAKIEEDPDVRSTDGEDRLTAELIGMLCSRTYDASHDEKIGGHSDIVVRHAAGYLWVGEAKIHSDYAYLEKGFNQLTTRYSPGTPNADQGALIAYVRVADCAGVLSTWRERLQKLGLPEYSEAECPARDNLAFFSTHKHEGSGRPMRVRHIAVKQHFNPKDRKVVETTPEHPAVQADGLADAVANAGKRRARKTSD
ncbi:hypothetical protein [Paraburkholderia phenazinium]|uniref:hypothetical protein n=1 Tax=Paraburkholderia phenazinium TaxID=60549 RepID=UPI00115F873C|nr:hypothetical protein [Paraburkholderia phenazinium]